VHLWYNDGWRKGDLARRRLASLRRVPKTQVSERKPRNTLDVDSSPALLASDGRTGMSRLLKLNRWAAAAIFVLLDIICVGMGMGVPIFCIGLGFPVGWYIAARAVRSNPDLGVVLKRTVVQATLTSAVTFAMMAVIWGSVAPMLLDPTADFVNFGIPMILYEPKVSFVGWLVLMIFISPFLQLLTTLFASHVTSLIWLMRRPQVTEQHNPADPMSAADEKPGDGR
jgi:hypothetical protein